ncbi:hypothetical protein BDF14DRAFT_1808494 [Spinellus fusiger]|nr:hypothetical protein BDF14DRAFT_1808494 [Spinellus fusiger]
MATKYTNTLSRKGTVPMTAKLGLVLGVISLIGLVVLLFTLLPLNIYNTVLATLSLKDLLEHEYIRSGQLRPLSSVSKLCILFLVGSIVSSLTTVIMVFGVCFRSTKSLASIKSPPVQRSPTTDSHPPWSREREIDLESNFTTKREKTYLPLKRKRWICITRRFMYISQIIWACFGTYLLFIMDLPPKALPDTVSSSALLSLFILWFNGGILSLFTLILVVASFFTVAGGKKKTNSVSFSKRHPVVRSVVRSHERTPLLKETVV